MGGPFSWSRTLPCSQETVVGYSIFVRAVFVFRFESLMLSMGILGVSLVLVEVGGANGEPVIGDLVGLSKGVSVIS